MKQVLQDLKTGAVVVADTPDPVPVPGRLLVRVQASLLSAGTEGAQVAKGQQSLLMKILEKPRLLRQGLEELRERGVAGLRQKLADKFEGYGELGYSCAGTVVHDDDNETCPRGALVACAGAGVAHHAEFVSVPPLLAALAPDGVSAEAAAYTTVGAIAMQGVRQAGAQLGEYVVVIGLGLVGLLTTQLLRATGCRVAGVDPSSAACRRGVENGCDVAVPPEQALDAVLSLSQGLGADAVIICAATSESSPVEMAGRLARSRGRVVMVGATGMTIPREEYYRKELSFTLSRSYGPGRYDRGYEEEGRDYPVDYVRFTEQRNMRAFLELVQSGRVDPARLTTHRFAVEEASAAYALLNDRALDRVGIVLNYPHAATEPTRFAIVRGSPGPIEGRTLGLAFIGAGQYAQGVLLPLLKQRADSVLRSVMTRGGSHALHAARRFGIETVCSRVEEVLNNPAVHVVFITTRHDSHADLAGQALRAGKHVWVEKPLALSMEELQATARALREHPASRLVVGFNRPFSPAARWLFERFNAPAPRMMTCRVNAGFVPADSWVHDPRIGGGRLLGEGCHFFDLLRHAAGAEAETVLAEAIRTGRADLPATANFTATIRFANGSVGQLFYTSQGAPRMGKEHFECFGGRMCGAIHDYREAEFFHDERREQFRGRGQDKGQAALLNAFLRSLLDGAASPVRIEDVLESTLLTLAVQQSLDSRQSILVSDLRRLVL